MKSLINRTLLKTILLISSLICLSSCLSKEERDNIEQNLKKYKNNHFDILVPKVCSNDIKNKLIKLKKNSSLIFEYRKFSDLEDAYSNIDGYVSFKTTSEHPMLEILNLKNALVKNCYADLELYFENNTSGWSQFRNEIKSLESNNVSIHSIKITPKKISVFINSEDVDYLN